VAELTPEHYWLAGLLEGEGSFLQRRDRNGHLWLGVTMATTDEDVARRCEAVAGGKVRGPYRRGRWKPIWRWSVERHQDVISLMEMLRPLMGERRAAQIDDCLNAFRSKREVRNEDKTHCPQGHPYSGGNLYVAPHNGSRQCRECRRRHAATVRSRQREQMTLG
jgi:hypothetical protein